MGVSEGGYKGGRQGIDRNEGRRESKDGREKKL